MPTFIILPIMHAQQPSDILMTTSNMHEMLCRNQIFKFPSCLQSLFQTCKTGCLSVLFVAFVCPCIVSGHMLCWCLLNGSTCTQENEQSKYHPIFYTVFYLYVYAFVHLCNCENVDDCT